MEGSEIVEIHFADLIALNGLWTHTKGGFYHDGRFPALGDVVNHYDNCMSLGLTGPEKADLVEFLKSLPQPIKNAE